MDPNRTIKPKPLLSVLRGALDRRIKQRARDTMVRNAVEDPAKPYAQRVVEEDACDFCRQLGTSRPVKPSQIASRYHQYCKCHVALFFQETRFKDRFTSKERLEKLGITIEDGASPDDWEKRTALILASAGHRIRFLKEIDKNRRRRSDIKLNGLNFELKNPTGDSGNTIQNQLLNNFYGNDGETFNPQSSRLVISNVRSSMSMLDMERGLAKVLSGNSRISSKELDYMDEIVLVDSKTGRVRRYTLK